ncbi:hypothetical protein HPP92_019156 [Vanilla planifolia]|uniref:Uncharacterized protein n=1 Tax=Vanilla planifolia TaxID=51239 RepID=A0A835UQ26_VANPL|nr:hypothetical protein HPP92_019156 [Vanilla planifolia]
MKRAGDGVGLKKVIQSDGGLALSSIGKEIVGVVRAPGQKPPFRLVQDDTKPLLQDPILRSDSIDTEQALIRLPPFPLYTVNL